MNFNDIIDSENLSPIVDIDLSTLEWDSSQQAQSIIELISRIYKDQEFLKNNPDMKNRLDIDMENIKSLWKSKLINEKLQDNLVNAVSIDPSNSALYNNLVNLQKTQLMIGERLDKIIDGLRSLIEESVEDDDTNVHRGRRDFIKSIYS